MRFLPVSMIGVVIVFYAFLFGYALTADSNLPSWSAVVPLLIGIVAGFTGVFAAQRLAGWKIRTVSYTVFLLIALGGVMSFYLLQEPTTINVFGGLAIIAGLLGALIMGAILALKPALRQ